MSRLSVLVSRFSFIFHSDGLSRTVSIGFAKTTDATTNSKRFLSSHFDPRVERIFTSAAVRTLDDSSFAGLEAAQRTLYSLNWVVSGVSENWISRYDRQLITEPASGARRIKKRFAFPGSCVCCLMFRALSWVMVCIASHHLARA